MSPFERFISYALLLLITVSFSLLFHVLNTNERMAKDGFVPFRLMGDGSIYWQPIPTDKEDPMIKKI